LLIVISVNLLVNFHKVVKKRRWYYSPLCLYTSFGVICGHHRAMQQGVKFKFSSFLKHI